MTIRLQFWTIFTFVSFCCSAQAVDDWFANHTIGRWDYSFGTLEADLFEAVKAGASDEIKRLVAQGANVNFCVGNDQPHYGISLLGVAMYMHSLDEVGLLIDLGANVNDYRDRDLGLDWQLLGYFGCASPQGCRAYPLLTCAIADGLSFDLIKLLIDSGADVNKQSFWAVLNSKVYWSPLMVAAHYGRCDVVGLLLEHGACVNTKNEHDNNRAAIDYARLCDHIEVVDLLLTHPN